MSLSKPKGLPPLLSLGAVLEYPQFEAEKRFEVGENRGQKLMFEPCLNRLSRFAGWCFDSKDAAGKVIIVSGHSLYFKNFFQMWVPPFPLDAEPMDRLGIIVFVGWPFDRHSSGRVHLCDLVTSWLSLCHDW